MTDSHPGDDADDDRLLSLLAGEKTWGYISFVGLAIGLLAKGPLALVLFGLAAMPWLMLQHGFIGGFRDCGSASLWPGTRCLLSLCPGM